MKTHTMPAVLQMSSVFLFISGIWLKSFMMALLKIS